MGNVLDCSTDPLDQIHESDDAPMELPPAGDEERRSQASSHVAGRENGSGSVKGEKPRPSNPKRSLPEASYLERDVPLRDSMMWKLQREYYMTHHVECWEKMVVPCFVTSNSFIARAYARVLVGFMRDWFLFNDQADRSEPIAILEIGSGHGKFASLVLQHLLDMREFLPTLTTTPDGVDCRVDCNERRARKGEADGDMDDSQNLDVWNERARQGDARSDGLPFRYVVTDVAQGTLDYVRNHPSMEGFLSEGVLEVAILDAEDPNPPSELLLQVSGRRVDLGRAKNPVVSVCNYVFDSLLQDAFRIKDKTLYENRVSITATRPLPAKKAELALNALEGLGLQWQHRSHAISPERAKAYYAGITSTTAETNTAAEEKAQSSSPPEDDAVKTIPGSDARELNGHGRDAAEGGDCTSVSPPPLPSTEKEDDEEENGTDSIPKSERGEGVEETTITASRDKKGGAEGVMEGENGAMVEENVSGGDDGNSGSGSNAVDGEGIEDGDTATKGEDAPHFGSSHGVVAATIADEDSTTSFSPAANGSEAHTSAAPAAANDGPTPSSPTEPAGSERGTRDSDFDGLLASYLEGSYGESGGSLLVPLGGLRLLRHLSSLSRGRGLVLVGDKGYVGEDEMLSQRDPHIAYHGSLSCMVNMDALSKYTSQRGGWSLSSPYMEGFKCQALVFGMEEDRMQETRLAFEDSTQAFGPESFSTLQRTVKDEVAQPSAGLVMQLLRLSRLDPDVFMKFRASIVEQVSSQELPPAVWQDLQKDAVSISNQWYPLQQGRDVNFEAARLLMALKDFESALVLFHRSLRVSGEHPVTCHNMGMSYFYLGKLKKAKAFFERSLELDPTWEDSVQWLVHVKSSMAPPSSAATSLSPVAGVSSPTRPSVAELRTAASVDGSPSPPIEVEQDPNLNNLSI